MSLLLLDVPSNHFCTHVPGSANVVRRIPQVTSQERQTMSTSGRSANPEVFVPATSYSIISVKFGRNGGFSHYGNENPGS
jgi:23S rRNA A1618 N6-methylase RlmF